MPSCKNGSGSYTGKEPSPKGRGYCARHEKIGTKKRGRDKKMWVVKSVKLASGKRSRRWFKVLPPAKKSKAKPTKRKRPTTKHKTKRLRGGVGDKSRATHRSRKVGQRLPPKKIHMNLLLGQLETKTFLDWKTCVKWWAKNLKHGFPWKSSEARNNYILKQLRKNNLIFNKAKVIAFLEANYEPNTFTPKTFKPTNLKTNIYASDDESE